MSKQSVRHLLLIEPAEFYANPETMDTNDYQVEGPADHHVTFQKALQEFRHFRDVLVENGVIVTTVLGREGCPDHLFPNWASTHEDGGLVLYPMRNPNRQAERVPEMINLFQWRYDLKLDLSDREAQGQFLESTGSLCLDRVNKVAYVALSKRTDEDLARHWGQEMGYDIVTFETENHAGQPVYHTDLVMFIGTEVAGLCAPCIRESDRARVLGRLQETHDVVEFSADQLGAFCGNSLEVRGHDDKPALVMSQTAYDAVTEAQKDHILQYMDRFIYVPIPTIEKYGGGSARCLIMELF